MTNFVLFQKIEKEQEAEQSLGNALFNNV